MENPVVFEMRYAAHQARAEKVNRDGWKKSAETGAAPRRGGRFAAALAGALGGLVARRARLAKASSAPAS